MMADSGSFLGDGLEIMVVIFGWGLLAILRL